MITVGMNYRIREGKEEEFEAVFQKVLQVMGAMEGHQQTNLYRDVAERSSYLIISEWASRSAFEVFTSSEQFKNVTDWGKSNILASRPKHEIYGDESSKPSGCPVHGH